MAHPPTSYDLLNENGETHGWSGSSPAGHQPLVEPQSKQRAVAFGAQRFEFSVRRDQFWGLLFRRVNRSTDFSHEELDYPKNFGFFVRMWIHHQRLGDIQH